MENTDAVPMDADLDAEAVGNQDETEEGEGMEMAERLAAAQERSSAQRGELKATREGVLEYMLSSGRQEMQIGNVKFNVAEKPEPIKAAVLYAETLKRHYDFKASDLDELEELVADTKNDLAKLRPVLVTRVVKPNGGRKSSHRIPDESDVEEEAEPKEGGNGFEAEAEAEAEAEPEPEPEPMCRPGNPPSQPGHAFSQPGNPLGQPGNPPSQFGDAIFESVPTPPLHFSLAELRAAAMPSKPPASKKKKTTIAEHLLSAVANRNEAHTAKSVHNLSVYDREMNLQYAAAGARAPDCASNLFFGPMARVVQNIQDAKSR